MRALSRLMGGLSAPSTPPKTDQPPRMITETPSSLRQAVMQLFQTALAETDIPAAMHSTMLRFLMQRSDSELEAMARQLCDAADALRPFVPVAPSPSTTSPHDGNR